MPERIDDGAGGSPASRATATAPAESPVHARRAGEHLEQDETGRVDVGRGRDHLAARLLGAEVVDTAQRRAGHRQLRLAEGARDAEVGDLDPAAARQQHVRRLDVAVDDAARMRCVERLVDLLGDARGGHGLERAALVE